MTEEQKATTEAVTPNQAKAAEKRPESRLKRFLRGALRRLLAFLIIFGLGMLLALYAFYMPTQRALGQTRQKLAALEGQAGEANTLLRQNQELQEALDKANLHIIILSARADVAAAQLALAQGDAAKARLALSQTSDTLKKLADLLEPQQKKLAGDLQERLSLAVKGIGSNNYAAASDLDVLMAGLVELENAYFTKP